MRLTGPSDQIVARKLRIAAGIDKLTIQSKQI